MASFRRLITAFLVCALTALPAVSASAAMRMTMTDTMGSMTSDQGGAGKSSMLGGCDDHGDMLVAEDTLTANPDEGISKKDDTSTPTADDQNSCPASSCPKCLCLGLVVTGVIATSPAAPSLPYTAIVTGWATPSLLAPSILPPSPPPRV